MADVDAKRLSKAFKGEYRLENNTLKLAVKDDPKDRIEIEVGDAKQPDFKPQWKISRWDNAINFSLRAQEDPEAIIETVDDKVIYKARNYEVHQYEKPEASDEGGYEFEWVLPSKPETNVLTATIQTKGLDFFYQGELTPDEIAEGAHRPENVVGSYAAYHKTKRDNYVGGKEYKAGKAFHIYRPKAVDNQGSEVWCDLHIDEANELLTVTVPQEFLDDAKYPVVVDPTFGYTSVGGTTISLTSRICGVHSGLTYVANSGDTVTGISAYGFVSSATSPRIREVGIYDISSNLPQTLTGSAGSVTFPANDTPAWQSDNTLSIALSAGTTYGVALASSNSTFTLYRDTVGGNQMSLSSNGVSQNPALLQSTWSHSSYSGQRYSLYATYSAGASSSESTAGITATLEKPTSSTSAIIATLEKPTGSTVAVSADLEETPTLVNLGFIGYLGGFYLGSVPLAGAIPQPGIPAESTAGIVTILEKPTQSTTAVITTLEKAAQFSTAAILTTLEAPRHSTTGVYTELENDLVFSTSAVLTTLEGNAQSTAALFTTLESATQEATAAILTTLEKPSISTNALLTILEKPTSSTAALLTALEKFLQPSSTAVLAILEAPRSSTVPLLTILEKPAGATVPLITALERVSADTLSLSSILERITVSPAAVLAILESNTQHSTTALHTLLEEGGSATLGVLTVLEKPVVRTVGIRTDLIKPDIIRFTPIRFNGEQTPMRHISNVTVIRFKK